MKKDAQRSNSLVACLWLSLSLGCVNQPLAKAQATEASSEIASMVAVPLPHGEQGAKQHSPDPAADSHFDQGADSEARHDMAAAEHSYRLAAEGGHIGAQARLGAIYANGEGLPQDYAQAERWLRRASRGGEPEAAVALALMTLHGRGVSQNASTAACRTFQVPQKVSRTISSGNGARARCSSPE